ncbi:YchF/TatD family DNA exonuclease, partial [bacterium]|nr:YchF/TatD family DNA exonuclease [bacterium]
MLIDSHVHLNMSRFAEDREEVIRRALSAGVEEMLGISYDPQSVDETVALSEKYGLLYAAVGIHPHEAEAWNGDLEEKIKKALFRKKVLAVGEIGLDYYRDLSPRHLQREIFKKQIAIAIYFGKPIIVHCREAFDDVIEILRQEGAEEVGGVFHAFQGGIEEAKEILALGFLVGIGGPVTYKNSRLPATVKRLPSSSFVLETDCPYLPPAPHRGKRNEPSYVKLVAEKVANIKGVTLEDIERATEANYRKLFHGEQMPPASISYVIKNNLYLNVTNFCTNDCRFCPRRKRNNELFGYNLNLLVEPEIDEIIASAESRLETRNFDGIVFCGYGEPTARLEVILEVAKALRKYGVPIRLDTNGQGNMINQRDIVPQLENDFQVVSVSLNSCDRDSYLDLCQPDDGVKAYDAVLDFLGKAAKSNMKCVATAVDCP